uniref:NADH-ubiquinone oxidoreductase chain 6 n=1 Tax=Rhagophthalminae sp. GENSP01 TaxID=1205577 RepID=A0A0S2MNV4_9COLE|nr:NADH deshydrogenase subunit 6 [Rhagophthalminae sp. GENSP01]
MFWIENILLISTLMFSLMNHPLSMGMILMLQTILVSLSTGMMSLNFWYSYILFMIMVGGMLVLFMYMTSVASNNKFLFSMKTMSMMTFMMIIMYMLMMKNYLKIKQLNKNEDMIMMNLNINLMMSLNKFMSFPLSSMFIVMIIYLLITMIAVVKITKIKYGPLKIKM